MSNCSSPEQGPRRIRTAHVDSYLHFLAGSLPERLNDLLPLGDIAIIPDGLIAAVLVARGAQGNHSHPAIAVLLEKEIDTDDLLLETFAIPTHTVTVHEARLFDERVSRYWAQLCGLSCVHRGRKPVSPQLKMKLPQESTRPITEAFYDMNIAEPVSFPFQPFPSFFVVASLSGQQFRLPLSAVFFAGSINRLRQLTRRQADFVERDIYKHKKEMRKIHVCLCTMLLYFLSMTNDETAGSLAFKSSDWARSRHLADEFGSEVHGNFGYEQNRIYLRDVRGHFGAECRKAAEFWCQGVEDETGRHHLEQGFERMEMTLYDVFQVERNTVASSSSSSHVVSHSSSKRQGSSFFPRARTNFDVKNL